MDEYEVKTSDAAGLSGTESPVESPVMVPVLSRPTSVYIIECAGYTKIGVAVDPFRRLAGINTGAPVPAVLYGSRQFETRLTAHEIESRLHRRFRTLRTNGEWFDIEPAMAMRALRAERPLKLRDPRARHDSADRWDDVADPELTDLLTQPSPLPRPCM